MMIVQVYRFTQNFTAGILKDMVIADNQLTFGSKKDAMAWFEGVNKNNEIGECDYYVTDFEKIGVAEVGVY